MDCQSGTRRWLTAAPGSGCARARCWGSRPATSISCAAPSTSAARSSASVAALCSGRQKGGKQRDVPLPQSVALALSAHIAQHPPASVTLPWQAPGGKAMAADLLFRSRRGSAIERNSWNATAWHPALRQARVQPGRDNGFHQLRHYYASSLLAGGVDIKALGHHSAAFTLSVYAHVMPDSADRIRQAVDALGSDGTTTAREAGNPR